MLDSIYTKCSQNGLEARSEFERHRFLAMQDDILQSMKPVGFGLSAFSAYNLSRFGVLSKGGQAASVVGLLFGLNLVFRSQRPTPETVLSTEDLAFKQQRLSYLAQRAKQ